MVDNPTAFQKLVNNDEVPKMIADLKNLKSLVPEDEDPEDVKNFELALSFDPGDVPLILEELEELVDEGE